ncbi:uncharacterized protein K452DRAFT_317415 [Aplosporella prunicola CBS 121167]|uniref:Centromere protein S n=1 Tax=Aplosporella prunicola CBS 121167 TaxID=1176127 RepID=A0A6A6BIH3_9PEZI|nr:uncharacterized protein K452DRAFT_317415 [Aplosporella prunicola CBS 121167]KAF2143223.1 hypothetical protein K452DRAFT_317415 [Aplosporella prunicola CBS 121167]
MASTPTDPSTTKEEALKSALWLSLGAHIDDTCLHHAFSTTPQFIGAFTELVYTQIQSAARDLAAFARHAGRAQVRTEDVLLLARRNEGLEGLLMGFVEELRKEEGGSGGAGRRTSAGAARGGVRKRGGAAGAAAGRGGAGRGRGAGRARGRGRGRGKAAAAE